MKNSNRLPVPVYSRSLPEQRSKTVFLKKQHLLRTTHSYAAQHAISFRGEIILQVFVCLQESTGNFGPRVQKSVNKLETKYRGIVFTSSKSGKLTTQLYELFLIDVVVVCLRKQISTVD